MRGRGRIPVRWGLAWGLIFVLGQLAFPRVPTHRIANDGDETRMLFFDVFADERTLIRCSYVRVEEMMFPSRGPLQVIDLPTGRVRAIELPDDEFQGVDKLGTESEWRARQETGWSLGWFRPIRDFVVVAMFRGNRDSRLHVWNWRTGREVLRYDTPGREIGVIGDLVWTRSRESAMAEETIELLEVPSGRRIPCDLPARGIDLKRAPRSPDGRFLAEVCDDGVRVWQTTPGVAKFTVRGAALAAFSSDSRWLATLSRDSTRRRHQEARRTWQIHETATGTLIAEQVQAGIEEWATESLAFHADDECVVTYADGILFKSGPPCRCRFSWIDTWDWNARKIHRHLPADGDFWDADDRLPVFPDLTTPRLVTTDQTLVDVANGAKLGKFEERTQTERISSSHRWMTVVDSSPQTGDHIAGWVRPLSFELGSRLESTPRLTLHDLESGNCVARLTTFPYECEFSPDSRWLVVQNEQDLEIWSLPPRRNMRTAFLVSLLIPALWGLRRPWRSPRRN